MKAQSQRELAKAVGKSQPAVRKWIHDDRWPFGKTGPWDVAKVKAWAAKTHGLNAPEANKEPVEADSAEEDGPKIRKGDIADLTAERAAKLELTKEKLESVKITNQLKRGQLHSIDDCRQRRVKQVIFFRDKLVAVADVVGNQLGLDSEQREILRGHMLGLCREFAGQDPAPPPSVKAAKT